MIKQFFKKVLISYLIIICCIYTPTAQAANWSFGGFNFGNGSLNIVKDGVKITTAAVDSAPITSNLGSKILSGALRGASVLTAISIIAGIGNDALDWVLDPATNAVKWKPKDGVIVGYYTSGTFRASTADEVCGLSVRAMSGFGVITKIVANKGQCIVYSDKYPNGGVATTYRFVQDTNKDWRPIPIPTVADKIYNNAKSGDTTSQADVTSAVTELVNSGAYDTPINQAIQDAINNGTLPKDTTPTTPEIDTSSITAAIQSLASSFASAISNSFNGITSVINTSIDKLLNKQDQIQGELVNTGSKIDAVGGKVVGVGDKVDNVGGKVVGVQDAVKDVGGKVVGLNDSVDKIGDKVVGVGDKVDAAGEKVGTRVDAVGDKVDAAGEKVGTRVDAAGEKTAEAIKESTKEITDKMEQTKPKDFELPAFCSWASKVCDFIDWVKEPNEDVISEPVDIQSPMPQMESTDLDFGGQCPQNFDINIDLFGKPVKFTLFDSNMFCQFLSDWIRIPVIFAASLVAVYILGGRRSD